MESIHPARRDFLWKMGGVAGAAWISAQWPAISAAAQHAHEAVNAKEPMTFDVLTAKEAKEVEAIAARIIPTDEEPGATEAGVVYFIDRALKTFASDDRSAYTSGLKQFNQVTSEMFPGVIRFSAASAEQQDKVMTEMSKGQKSAGGARQGFSPATGGDFFPIIWMHTLMGLLADSEAGGNRNYVGWKLIGRDPAHSFSPPFGEYDKDYPGWQAASAAGTDKK